MQRETDSSDTLTLTHDLKLKKLLTSVRTRLTLWKCQRSVREVSRVMSVKCQCVESCVVGTKVSERKIQNEVRA